MQTCLYGTELCLGGKAAELKTPSACCSAWDNTPYLMTGRTGTSVHNSGAATRTLPSASPGQSLN